MKFWKRIFGTGVKPEGISFESDSRTLSLDNLLEDLDSKSPKRVAAAAMSISILGDSALEPLLNRVRTGRVLTTRCAAAKALGVLGNPDAVAPLCELFATDLNLVLFREVAITLRRLADDRALNVLISALDNMLALTPAMDSTLLRDKKYVLTTVYHYGTRKALVESLGSLQDIRALSVLQKALRDNNPLVAVSAAKALLNLGELGINGLIAELAATTGLARWAAGKALEECNCLMEAQVDMLSGLLSDGSISDETKGTVVRVLGKSGARRIMILLLSALGSLPGGVRSDAADALGSLGDRRAVDPLVAALTEEDAEFQKSCCRALGLLGDASAKEPLAKLLVHTDSGVRLAAACALARFQDARAFDSLVHFLASKDEDESARSAQALRTLGDIRAIAALKKSLADGRKGVRRSALTALDELGGGQTIEAVASLLKDSELQVRLAAAEILAKRGDARGFDLMCAALLTDDLDDDNLLSAVAGLSALTDPRAIAFLISSLRGSAGVVQKTIIDALAKFGTPAKAALQPLLADPRALVRSGAQLVLDEMAQLSRAT